MQKIFENNLNKMHTDLTSSIDSQMKALKVDIDIEIGSQQSRMNS